MDFSRLWQALRNWNVALAFSKPDGSDVIWRVPWWVFIVLGALPLPIFLNKTDDPGKLLSAGILMLLGLLLAAQAVFSLGKGGSMRADLARLPLAFILLVSAGLVFAVNLPLIDKLAAPAAVSRRQAAEKINTELALFAWDKVKPLKERAPGAVKKVLLVDAKTRQVFEWQSQIVSPRYLAQTLEECDLILLIDETWQELPNKNWLKITDGDVTGKRPVKFVRWQVSALDPRTQEIIIEKTFDGAIDEADFIALSKRFKTDAEIQEWENVHCPPPLADFQKWLGGILVEG